jgi:DNA-directed RNA polymerase specialized sigma24 family protein
MLTANREEAKDLLQDTTLKALDNEDKYIDNVNFKGWVFTIMRNIFINNYRRVVRNQTIIDQTEDLYQSFKTSIQELSKARNQADGEYLEQYHRPALDNIFNTEEGIRLARHPEAFEKKDYMSMIKEFMQLQYDSNNLSGYLSYKELYDYINDRTER